MGFNLHLSKDLIEKYGIKRFGVRKGDIVRVVKGDSDKDEKLNIVGKEAKVIKVLKRERKVIVENINIAKADGKMKPRKLDPSSLTIVKIALEDAKRKQKLVELAAKRNKKVEEEIEEENKTDSSKEAPGQEGSKELENEEDEEDE